jgi:hypothetical protein
VLTVSNISDVSREREEFWKQAWGAERTPGAQRVELFGDRGTVADWEGVAADPTTPSVVAMAARLIATSRADPALLVAGKRSRNKPAGQIVELGSDDAVAWATALGDRFGNTRAERIIHYPKPRAGRVQEQFVAELPAECDEADVRAIVEALAKDLNSLGVRFTVVVHAPDSTNDRRNYHLHLIWYPGRSARAEDGSWQFGAKPGKPAKLRPGEIAVLLGSITAEEQSAMHHNTAAKADMKVLRTRYAGHVNARLARKGSALSYDPRTYVEMGIDKSPETHLGTAAGRLVAAGVPVAADIENALTSWSAAHRDLDRQLATRAHEHGGILQRIQTSLDQDGVQNNDNDRALLRLRDRCRAWSDEVLDGRAALDRFDLERAEAESAARRLQTGTAQLIASIEAGEARRDDQRNESYIRGRHRMAEQHLAEIEETIEPWVGGIEHYRRHVARAEREFARFAADAGKLVAERRRIKVEAAWRASSILPPSRYPQPLSGRDHLDALLDYMGSRSQQEAAHSGWPRVHLAFEGKQVVVTGLGSLDLAVLQEPRHTRQVEAALASMARLQAQQIRRPILFMERHGIAALAEARRPDEGKELSAVKNLYLRFHDHPIFVKALRAGEDRLAERCKFERDQSASVSSVKTDNSEGTKGLVQQAAPFAKVATEHDAADLPSGAQDDGVEQRAPTGMIVREVGKPVPTISSDLPRSGDGQTTVVHEPGKDADQTKGLDAAGAQPPQRLEAAVGEDLSSIDTVPAHAAAKPPKVGETLEPTDTVDAPPVKAAMTPEASDIGRVQTRDTGSVQRRRWSVDPRGLWPLPPSIAARRSGDEDGPASLAEAGSLASARALRDAPALVTGRVVRLGDGATGRSGVNGGLGDRPAHDPPATDILSNKSPSGPTRPAASSRPEDEVEAIFAKLNGMAFLPLQGRAVEGGAGRSMSFALVPEATGGEDAEILRRATAIADDRLQRFYAERWEAMLARLRELLIRERKSALAQTMTSGLKRGGRRVKNALKAEGWDPLLIVALEAAGPHPDIIDIVVDSERHWRDCVTTRLTDRRPLVPNDQHDSLRAAARRRASKKQADDIAPDLLAAARKDFVHR